MLKYSSLFFLGDWQVNPSTNTLRRGELVKQLEPKAMDVLLLLCAQQGQVLSADDIADQCWGGVDIGDNPVHKAINQLRKALADKPSTPTYIETIRKRGYHIIAKLDFPFDETLKAEKNSWQGSSPFPGLVAFEPKDAQVFFGRNEQVAILLTGLSKQVSAGNAFCLILGPSGTGKSSLVNAGILPALTNKNGYNGVGVESFTNIDFADISPQRLFVDLASAMLDWDVNDQPVFTDMSAENLAEQLQSDYKVSIEQCVNALKQTQQNYSNPRFLLFIDRLEVLLSSPVFSDGERVAFLDTIEKLTTSGAIIVLSACRNDFYPLVVNHPSLMANKANGAHFDLLAPTRAELMQMIRLPAVTANLTWSNDADSATPLDQLLCAEAANNPDALPMLQYTLQELYLQRSEADELQMSVYKALGGIEGAIGKKAEEVYQQLSDSNQAKFASVLSRLVTLSPDGETITSRAARWSQLTQASEITFVQAMVDSRLFVSHLQSNEPCFSLAHEALLRRWPRASEWISVHKDSLAIKSRLQQLSERWLSEDKSSAYLLPQGKPLEEALSLQEMPVFTLDADELALLKASQQKVKTKSWLTRSTIALLCLLTFTAIFMSVKSQQAEAFAQQKRLDAESLLGFMVGEFADKLRSVKRMDLLDGISNKALEYFSQQDAEYDTGGLFSLSDPELNFKAKFQHAQTLGAMGEVAYSRAKTEEAEQAFTSAKRILDKLFEEQSENMALLKNLGANAFWLGQIKYDNNDFEDAKPLFELYRDYSEQMNRLEPNNTQGWIELFYANNTLGSLLVKQQDYSNANSAFKSSLALIRQSSNQKGSDILLHVDKADTLSWLATTELYLGNLSTALSLHQEGQQMLEEALKQSPNNATTLELYAYSLWHQARLLDYTGHNEAAYNKASMAIQTMQQALQQDPSNEVWKAGLISIEILKLKLLSELNREDPELTSSKLNFYTDTIFTSQTTNPVNFIYLIEHYQLRNEWKQSADLIIRTKSYLTKYNLMNKKGAVYEMSLAKLYLLEAQQRLPQLSLKERLSVCYKAKRVIAPHVQNNSHVEYLLPYAKAHSCLNQLNNIIKKVNALKAMGIDREHFQM